MFTLWSSLVRSVKYTQIKVDFSIDIAGYRAIWHLPNMGNLSLLHSCTDRMGVGKKLPREHLISCQVVKMFLLKDHFNESFVIN